MFNGAAIKKRGDRIVNKPLAGTLHLLSMNYRYMYEGSIPSIMMKQISKENHADLITEIGGYTTKFMDTLSLDLKDNQEMITTSKTTGGPLLAYILNSVKGIDNHLIYDF